MFTNYNRLWSLLGLLFFANILCAQNPETSCDPTANLPVAQGEVLFNYGSTTNAFSFTNRSSFTIGQPVVGSSVGRDYISETGFWARFLLPPQAPVVQSSQGNFPDRVQISWVLDPLSASVTNGYVILRDGAYLDQVDSETNQYIDFNVQAGEFYQYSIIGRNQFGNGPRGSDIGFVNPNGVVTGKIETTSGNPVAGAIVTLEPTVGRALHFDGEDDYLCVSHHANLPTDMFTVSAWVKIDSINEIGGGIIDLGSDLKQNFWLHTTDGSEGKGIVAGIGDGAAGHELRVLFDDAPDDWHNVSMVYSGEKLILYVDGMYKGSMVAVIDNVPALFTIGSDRSGTNFFRGEIDDVRIYDMPLTQTDILLSKDITVSSTAENLVAYWKFDEGLGRNAFDLTVNEIHAVIEGATFSVENAGVMNAGMTDVAGYYSIEGVNYSEEQTFLARPIKNFYNHSSVEFNAAFGGHANLPSFDLPDTATVEITVQPFDLTTRQTLLSQGTGFELFLENSEFKLTLNGTTRTLGPATSDFQHLTLLLNDSGDTKYFLNGTLVNTLSGFSYGVDNVTTGWQLAASGGSSPSGFYTGLIGDLAVFDTLVSQANIQLHSSPLAGDETGVNAGDGNLVVFFPLDEGAGEEVYDYGPQMKGAGEVVDASFSIIAYRQLVTPHEFRPSQRVVNLNASATAVGNIDFVDESTVTIKGVVRFSETFCYQDSVEMLVNGERFFPPIYTDSLGRFVGDFEPGANVVLTPRFDDTTHLFSPGFFETRRLNRPIAGVLFQNTTKREVEGQIAGGVCRLSINDLSAPVRIKVAALNGCYEQEMEVTNAEGNYKFKKLPPVPMAVSIVYHPDPNIYGAFQLAGGSETDLRRIEKDTIDFIYTAPPKVELQPFDTLATCAGSLAFINQSTSANGYKVYSRNVRVYEEYLDVPCYLSNFNLDILNDISGQEPYSIAVTDTTTYSLEFRAGAPNIGGDYTKFLQVIGRTQTGTNTAVERVVVLGERGRESTFTSTAPTFPLFVLRDPPGDGSSSTMSEGTTTCVEITGGSLTSESSGGSLNVDVGAEFNTFTGLGAGTINNSEIINNLEIGGSVERSYGKENTAELCVTTSREYSTSDDDAVFGQDADLYVGAALNMEYSATDVLDYDYENCTFIFDTGFKMWPKGFGTTYIYSEWQIKTDVIPSLEQLGRDADADKWREIIATNEEAKNNATFVENITFDALNTYTQTSVSEDVSSISLTFDKVVDIDVERVIGQSVFSIGTVLTQTFNLSTVTSSDTTTTDTDVKEVSFTLADDDPNDNFSIDVLDDGVYGTPVFRTRAGESMCPWEPGTLNREQVAFNTNQLRAVNIPANSPAVFNLELTNDSQTGNDPLIYILGTVEGSNPNGAIISVDGEGLTEPRPFQILPGETIEVLLTVERGPTEYSYNDLGIFMASECMWEHSRGLGYDLSDHNVSTDRFGDIIRQGLYDPSDLAKFYKEFRLGVDFLEPCSPINIGFPMQDWVVTPDDNNQLTITLDSYINDDPDLNMVRVQYRPTGGDGSWINIVELTAADFAGDPVFKNIVWDMAELRDGAYDVRAVTECFDLALNPGISRIVQGRKETRPPELFGTPQPADGVLNPGDEISITFTKRIQCDRIFQADGIGTNINYNNLALVDATTGSLIDATITCSGDKILIVPNIPNQYIENRTLRVVTNGILDYYGNETSEIAWEFFVNRSNLYWEGGAINEMVQEGESRIVSREIRNQGGAITSFTIPDVPDWLSVFPRSGDIAPGERLVVNFEVDDDLLPEAYTQTLLMETVDGNEPLEVDFRVVCDGPEWSFNPSQYSFSMNLTVELDIEGDISSDEVDRVGAFVDGELRGIAYIEYNDELETDNGSVNPYLAFLTVYSNEVSGETVDFQIWDASACELFGSTIETFPFEPDGLVGEPLAPQTIHTNNEVLRKIYIHPGWNWISYNVDLADASTDAALESLTNPDVNSIIKGQTQFSQFTPSINRWLGSLTELSNLTMYQLRSTEYDSLTLIGQTVDPTLPIPVTTGWNWIGFLPSRGMTVTDALSSLTPLNGDIVKGQFAFAQYVAGVGWIGNLNNMSSPNGYLLRMSNAGTLVYPDADEGNFIDPTVGLNKNVVLTGMKSLGFSPWAVTPGDFEFSMNIVAVVNDSLEASVLADGDVIGALVDGEVRGAGEVIYVEALDAHLVFLTIYANQEGEAIDFKFYDASQEEINDLEELHSFRINQVMGGVETPQVFHVNSLLSSVGTPNEVQESFRAYPNPVKDKVFLEFPARVGEKVAITVHNVYGQQVNQIRVAAPGLSNTIEWTPQNLPPGVYTITLKRANKLETIKVELL